MLQGRGGCLPCCATLHWAKVLLLLPGVTSHWGFLLLAACHEAETELFGGRSKSLSVSQEDRSANSLGDCKEMHWFMSGEHFREQGTDTWTFYWEVELREKLIKMSPLCYARMKPDSCAFKRQNQEFAGSTRCDKLHQADSGKCHLLQRRMGSEI